MTRISDGEYDEGDTFRVDVGRYIDVWVKYPPDPLATTDGHVLFYMCDYYYMIYKDLEQPCEPHQAPCIEQEAKKKSDATLENRDLSWQHLRYDYLAYPPVLPAAVYPKLAYYGHQLDARFKHYPNIDAAELGFLACEVPKDVTEVKGWLWRDIEARAGTGSITVKETPRIREIIQDMPVNTIQLDRTENSGDLLAMHLNYIKFDGRHAICILSIESPHFPMVAVVNGKALKAF